MLIGDLRDRSLPWLAGRPPPPPLALGTNLVPDPLARLFGVGRSDSARAWIRRRWLPRAGAIPPPSSDEPDEDSDSLNTNAGTRINAQKNQAIDTSRSVLATDSGIHDRFLRTITTSSGPDGTSTVLAVRSGRLAWGRNTRRAYLRRTSLPTLQLSHHPSCIRPCSRGSVCSSRGTTCLGGTKEISPGRPGNNVAQP